MFNQDENYNLKQQDNLSSVFTEKKVQALFLFTEKNNIY